MAHEDAKPGDKIFWLSGCRSPVVLRKVRNDVDEHQTAQYTVMGQTYVFLTEEERYEYCGPIASRENNSASARRDNQECDERPKKWTFAEK